jgi:hypothetical protein
VRAIDGYRAPSQVASGAKGLSTITEIPQPRAPGRGRATRSWFSWLGAGGEFGALSVEGIEVGLEDGVEEAGLFDAEGADDFSEFEAAQAGGDDVGGGHAGHDAHAEALALVEFDGDDAGAQDLDLDAGSEKMAGTG